jgi:hypothetical protein
MGTKSGAKLNLYQCRMLVANGFLSTDGKKDYQHEEVIDRLMQLQANKDAKAIASLMRVQAGEVLGDHDEPPPIPSDADEGLDAAYDWQHELTTLTF